MIDGRGQVLIMGFGLAAAAVLPIDAGKISLRARPAPTRLLITALLVARRGRIVTTDAVSNV